MKMVLVTMHVQLRLLIAIKAGVVDPSKVTRSALENAASVVGLLLTTDVLIADKPEENDGAGAAAAAAAGMGGMGMGGGMPGMM